MKAIVVGANGKSSTKRIFALMKEGILLHRRKTLKGEYWTRYENNNIENGAKSKGPDVKSGGIVIRWGNRIILNTGNFIPYNRSSAIKMATNKKVSRQLFIEKGVSTPKLITPETWKVGDVIIARPLKHSQGKNFVVLENKSSFIKHYKLNSEGWYYSEYIAKEEEFRVHCGLGKILAVRSKPKGKGHAWNHDINGQEFPIMKWEQVEHDVCLQALKAIEALGLDFGGVDVMWKDGKAYVLEVNTSPETSSSEYTSKKYAQLFDFIFRNTKDEPIKHWDFSKYKKVKSFFWKEEQFNGNETK